MPLTQAQLDAIDSVLNDIQPHTNTFATSMQHLTFLQAIHNLPDGQGGNVFSDAAATAILDKLRTDLKSAANSIHTLIP